MTTNLTRIGDLNPAVDFAILGPLQVRRSGLDVRLAGVRQRTLLAALLLTVDRPVTVDRLIDLLWGDQPPASCRGDLQANVSRLRRLLAGDYGVRRSSVIHSAGGYLIPAGFGSLDLAEFDRLSAAAGKADHAAAAVDLLRQALGFWRGRVCKVQQWWRSLPGRHQLCDLCVASLNLLPLRPNASARTEERSVLKKCSSGSKFRYAGLNSTPD